MFIACFSGKCQQPMFLLWQLGQSALKRPDTTCGMYVYIERGRKSKNILMRKYLTNSDRQSVREEEKHSSIRSFAISSEDMSNVVEEKREDSVTYLHVSTDEKYELIFLFLLFSMCVYEYQADLSNICWL